VITLGIALVAATLMHLAEGHVQPDKLGTIPEALWWAIVTLGTIGYGDVVPVTALGKLIATCTIFFGLIVIALPVGIIATAFADQIHRRNFIVTWGMIARVPLFAELDAAAISDIMGLLRAQVAEAGEVVGAGQAVLRVATVAHPWVRVYINEKDLPRIRLGQDAEVRADGLPGKVFNGRVVFISPEAEFTPKTVETRDLRVDLMYRVKVEVANPDGALKIGMPADVTITPASS
jgi:hypothetical protein